MPLINVGPDDRRQLDNIANVLAKSKKIIVVTGAGISTNCGIPDFRSEDGLYSLIQGQYESARSETSTVRLPAPTSSVGGDGVLPSRPSASLKSSSGSLLPLKFKGRDLFDSLVWKDPLSTSIFYKFIAYLRKKIREEVKHTTPTHKFLRTLRDGGKLVRCYTQNIDGLEARDGLCTDLSRGKGNRSRFRKRVVNKPRSVESALPGSELDGGCEVVQLHGDLHDLRCTLCEKLCSWEDEDQEEMLLSGRAPECSACVTNDEDRRSRGKRGTAVGTLRPNVILYGEEHPLAHSLSLITTHDIGLAPDVLLILGTSLRVHGLKVLVKEFAKSVHARGGGKGKVVFINRTKPSESVWNDVIDWWVGMDCDEWVHDLHERRSDLWQRQGALQLSVTKKAGENGREHPRLTKTDMNEAEINKENLTVGSEYDTFEEHLASDVDKQNMEQIKHSRVASTGVQSPAKTPLNSASMGNIDPLGTSRDRVSRMVTPKTPSRNKSSKSASEQLLTPPSSTHGFASKRDASDQVLQSRLDVDELVTSPSKRTRHQVEIWVDVTDGQWAAFPSRMAVDGIPISAAASVASKGKKRKVAAA
ncbi:MAG: hypothetical protein M1830_001773 [Pleopsidium flavum]|nr:MAG: hypothetical protein M1830_001773 [Pleopsidium flavum]